MSGGTERSFGRLSLGADNINGIFPDNMFQRRTANLSGTFKASEKLTADGSVQYIRNSGRNRPGVGYSGRNPLQSMFNWFGRQVDIEALKNRFYPVQTIDTSKETLEWLQKRMPPGIGS